MTSLFIKLVFCVLLLALVTSCGRRPPPPMPSGDSAPGLTAGSVDQLIHANTSLQQQLGAEQQLRHRAEQRLALEQSWRGRWQMVAFITALAAVLALLIGMGLGSQSRKEVDQTHDHDS